MYLERIRDESIKIEILRIKSMIPYFQHIKISRFIRIMIHIYT